MFKTSYANRQRRLPLVIEPDAPATASLESLIDATSRRREFFEENLRDCGALLFRGFGLETVADFERFVREFSEAEFFKYAGGVSPRLALSDGGVYTSTEYPAHLTLALHNEMSYSESYPRRLYFFCVTPAAAGGATTLGDSRRILRALSPATIEIFQSRGVRYDRYLRADENSEYSWRAAFETGDRAEIERICERIGAAFEWQANGDLRLSQTRPATAVHPATGASVWFNQADGFHESNLDAATREYFRQRGEQPRLNSFYGDGAPIAVETLDEVRRVLNDETIPHEWRTGDVLILDNLLTAHGRMPFAGTRKIALAMT